MATAGNWLLKLRCYKCRTVFTVRRVAGDKIASATDASVCPHCGARGDSPQTLAAPRRHFLLEMAPDTQSKS